MSIVQTNSFFKTQIWLKRGELISFQDASFLGVGHLSRIRSLPFRSLPFARSLQNLGPLGHQGTLGPPWRPPCGRSEGGPQRPMEGPTGAWAHGRTGLWIHSPVNRAASCGSSGGSYRAHGPQAESLRSPGVHGSLGFRQVSNSEN